MRVQSPRMCKSIGAYPSLVPSLSGPARLFMFACKEGETLGTRIYPSLVPRVSPLIMLLLMHMYGDCMHMSSNLMYLDRTCRTRGRAWVRGYKFCVLLMFHRGVWLARLLVSIHDEWTNLYRHTINSRKAIIMQSQNYELWVSIHKP